MRGGRYAIKKVLGQGGFGITYLASDKTSGADVAIKEFFPRDYCGRGADGSLTANGGYNAELVDTLRRRFFKEANNLSRLAHPNIVKVHEVFEELSTAYIVMEYISGEDLNTLVRRRPGGKLDENTAVAYIRSIGSALAYMHSRRMTHLDVKPANIMVRTADNTPILIDFGFSKEYTPTVTNLPSMTPPAITPGYSPLELYDAANMGEFSPQSDIYSLGASLYFLVLGLTPPSAPELIQGRLRLPASLTQPIRQAITTAMRVRRSERTDKVDDVLQLLPETIVATIDDDDDDTIEKRLRPIAKKLAETEIALDKLGKELERTKRELENWKRRATKAEATVDWQNRVIAQKEQESGSSFLDKWYFHVLGLVVMIVVILKLIGIIG